MEVEVREQASSDEDTANNTQQYPIAEGPVVIVRVEEVLLVVLVLMIWVAAIALFFNRWGKIRMLEPYQPKFNQQPHRPSCPLAPLSPLGNGAQQRMSFSKYNINAMTDPLSALPSPIIRRPRQNSVFVGGSAAMAILNPPPRRAKSAMDIHHLIVNERISPTSLAGSKGSVIAIPNRRLSMALDRPTTSRLTMAVPRRRSSCFIERPSRHHRHFISFEHHQPPSKPSEAARFQVPRIKVPKVSRSFEQPAKDRPIRPPERMANSLDVDFEAKRRCSIAEEETGLLFLDEGRITAPLLELEGLKSSDV